MQRISLSGNAGTGKTTISKLLADQLNFKFISIGNFTRDFAKTEFNMNITEFQVKCLHEPELDELIDIRFRKLCNEKHCIVADYRLGFHFIKNSFNILLKVSDEVAFQRIINAKKAR